MHRILLSKKDPHTAFHTWKPEEMMLVLIIVKRYVLMSMGVFLLPLCSCSLVTQQQQALQRSDAENRWDEALDFAHGQEGSQAYYREKSQQLAAIHSYPLALAAAAYANNTPLIRELIARGDLDINAPTGPLMRTPLHYAALGNSRDAIEQLLQAGARVSETDYLDLSPYAYARHYHPETDASQLLNRGLISTDELTYAAQWKREQYQSHLGTGGLPRSAIRHLDEVRAHDTTQRITQSLEPGSSEDNSSNEAPAEARAWWAQLTATGWSSQSHTDQLLTAFVCLPEEQQEAIRAGLRASCWDALGQDVRYRSTKDLATCACLLDDSKLLQFLARNRGLQTIINTPVATPGTPPAPPAATSAPTSEPTTLLHIARACGSTNAERTLLALGARDNNQPSPPSGSTPASLPPSLGPSASPGPHNRALPASALTRQP